MRVRYRERQAGRRHFLQTLGLGSGALLLRGSAIGGAIAAGVAGPARAAGTTIFDPALDPTLQGFTELLAGAASGTPNVALGLFDISDPPAGHLYYQKPLEAASAAISLSSYVKVGTGASSAGSVGAFLVLDAGLTGTGSFAGRLELHCGYAPDGQGVLRPTLGILDQNAQFSHTIPFDWQAGGAFEFGRRANGDPFVQVPGGPSLDVPAAQISGPQASVPTFAFGCPFDPLALLAEFGAIRSLSTLGMPVPSVSGAWLVSALSAVGVMALRRRRTHDE